MSHEQGVNKKKKEEKKQERMSRLTGVDLCACGSGDRLRCHGICRENHTDKKTGQVRCEELYRVSVHSNKKEDTRRPNKDWRYGRQKDRTGNNRSKQWDNS